MWLRAIGVLISCAIACVGESAGDRPTDTSARGDSVTHPADSVRVVLEAPAESRVSATVLFALSLRNESAQGVDLYLRGREPTFDVIVRDSSGREVWSRLHDSIIPAVIRLEHLRPSQALELRHSWDLRDDDARPVRPGPYVAVARVLTDGEPLESAPRRFEIVP